MSTIQIENKLNQEVMNLGIMADLVESFPALYNPPRYAFTASALRELKSSVQAILAVENDAICADNTTTAICNQLLDNFVQLTIRSLNSLNTSAAKEQTIEQGHVLVREIKSHRDLVKSNTNDIEEHNQNNTKLNYIALDKDSLDSQLNNISKYVHLIAGTLEYNPFDPDLLASSMINEMLVLKTACEAVKRTKAILASIRVRREVIFSGPFSGVYDIQQGVKEYTKTVFGSESAEYKSMNDLRFRKTNRIGAQSS